MYSPNQYLKRERQLRGWSQSHFAKQIDAPKYYISRWERGEVTPSPYYQQKLCELLGKTAEELGFLQQEESAFPASSSLSDEQVPSVSEPEQEKAGNEHTSPDLVAIPSVQSTPRGTFPFVSRYLGPRRLIIIGSLFVILVISGGVVSSFMPPPRPPSRFAAKTASPPGTEAKTEAMRVTFYGPPDNDPPGNGISNSVIHKDGADGDGTFDNPTTFATDKNEQKPGTKIYVPYLKRYFIMEDTCATCTQDFNNKPLALRISLWIGREGTPDELVNCEKGLTEVGTVPVTVNPDKGLKVASGPLFNPSTGCFKPEEAG
jgi:transcriptional regulator with XRE-family HTH domain